MKTAMGAALVLSSCCLASCETPQDEEVMLAAEVVSEEVPHESGEPEDGVPAEASEEGSGVGAILGGELIEGGPMADELTGKGPSATAESTSHEDGPAGQSPDYSQTPAAPVSPTPTPPASQPAVSRTFSISPACSVLADLTNERRACAGIGALALDASLCQAAQERAEEMAAAKLCSHTRPGGGSCFSVLDQHGIAYGNAGENIADGFSSAHDVCEAFCNSASHRENILSPAFSKLGTGLAKSSNNVCYWVQLFSD